MCLLNYKEYMLENIWLVWVKKSVQGENKINNNEFIDKKEPNIEKNKAWKHFL